MKTIKSRIEVVLLFAFAGTMIYGLWEFFAGIGATAEDISGAEDSWGFQFVASNLHWFLLLAVILVALLIMVYERFKKRYR